MAKTQTVAAVKAEIDRQGYCIAPFATVEYFLGVVCEDDDEFESAILAATASLEWVEEVSVDWVNRAVLITGPELPSAGT